LLFNRLPVLRVEVPIEVQVGCGHCPECSMHNSGELEQIQIRNSYSRVVTNLEKKALQRESISFQVVNTFVILYGAVIRIRKYR